MKCLTLQLYVLRLLLTSLGFALAGIGMIVLPSITVQAIHRLGGVSLLAVLQYLPLVLAEVVAYLLPMAFLLAVVATYGKLVADNEWTAMLMAGIHPVWALLPGVLVASLLDLGTLDLLARVAPQAKFERRNFLYHAELDELRAIVDQGTEFALGPFFIKASEAVGNVKRDVLFNAPAADGQDRTLVADTARFDFVDGDLVVWLEGVTYLAADAQPQFESLQLRVPLDEISPVVAMERSKARYWSSEDIESELSKGGLDEVRRTSFLYELHSRRALAATYLLFLLLGVPTGMFLKSNTHLGAFTAAMVFAFLYYVLALRLGKELGRAGVVPPVAAAWSTDALFLLAGGFAVFRVLRR